MSPPYLFVRHTLSIAEAAPDREVTVERREATISLRLLIPFLRLTGASPGDVPLLVREGISLAYFAAPCARIRHGVAMELLASAVHQLNDPALGLRAAELVEAADLDVLEFALASCATLRQAIATTARFMPLMHGAQESSLVEHGSLATWELRILDRVCQPPAANDFVLACAVLFAKRYTGRCDALRTVRFRHHSPTDSAWYARLFHGARLEFGARHNSIVFAREYLDAPMSHAHAGLQQAYAMHAETMLEQVRRGEGVTGRVRVLLTEHVGTRPVSMGKIARLVAMSVPTLRRHLAEEGSSFSEIYDEVRQATAQRFLNDRSMPIRTIAEVLGYSHVSAFYKAFRRWSPQVTPWEYRAGRR
jgi:AraC-like DNA-binding protein